MGGWQPDHPIGDGQRLGMKLMRVVREHLGRLLTVLALVIGMVALGAWWSSLLVAKASGTLTKLVEAEAARQITSEINQLSPGTGGLASTQQAIQRALHDPQVTQALAGSGSAGSQALRSQLSRLDPNLAQFANSNAIAVDVGQHTLARVAHDLRSTARTAAIAAGILAIAALVVSPLRQRVLRQLGMWAIIICGLAVIASWFVPDIVERYTHGSARDTALTILHGGDPARAALLWCLGAGAVVLSAGIAFELSGGAKVGGPQAPLAPGRVV